MSRGVDRLSIRERPGGPGVMRQNWGKLLFMHWPLPAALLRPLIPPRLTIDTFEGEAWIGVTPFTMWGVRASFMPPVPGLSEMHELNVRTYVHLDGVPGVWFFSLDVESLLAVWGARAFYHLPYYHARMSLRQEGRTLVYRSERAHAGAPRADFAAAWTVGEPLEQAAPDSLTFFLTERYCLYSARGPARLYRARIHHPPWPLRRAEVSQYRSTMLAALGLPEPSTAPLLHYAEALRVDIWPVRRV